MSLPDIIIGASSQIAKYFPENIVRTSSRQNYDYLLDTKWDTVYVCFGENRTYMAESNDENLIRQFYDINYDLTIQTVEAFAPISRRVVVYSTAELWNDCVGPVGIHTPFGFKSNHYILSKYNLTVKLKDKNRYPNVSIAYPFNFNGVHRKGEFLFGKVFDSILNRKRIRLGDTYYYRDILHPVTAANESMIHEVGEDFMIGSGRVIFVNDLIRSLYHSFGMEYDDMVEENITSPSHYRQHIFYSDVAAQPPYQVSLLEKLICELKGIQNVY